MHAFEYMVDLCHHLSLCTDELHPTASTLCPFGLPYEKRGKSVTLKSKLKWTIPRELPDYLVAILNA